MKIIEQLRTRWHEKALSNDLPAKTARHSVSLEEAQSVGILFDGTEPEERELVLDYAEKLKREGKKVKLLAFFNSNLDSGNFTFWHFNRKQLDWSLRPKIREAEEFASQRFDLLLNLSQKAVAPLEYVAARSKAAFRVGPATEKTVCYDLMIDLSGQPSNLKAFLQQVIFYLKKTRPQQSLAA